MIRVILLLSVFSVIAFASPFQTATLQDDGSYQFFYETGDDAGNQMRSESRGPDGVVVGRYGYKDPTGEHRVVNYRADDLGYVAQGDVGVAGAPETQFPAQPLEDSQQWSDKPVEEHYGTSDSKNIDEPDKKQDAKKDDESKYQTSDDHPDKSNEDEEEEDDVKPIRLPEPSEDTPPDGFPVGFFTHQFHNLRRLPEPKSEKLKADDTKATKPEKGARNEAKTDIPAGPVAAHHEPHPYHFSSFPHPGWAAGPLGHVPGVHQPVYVYSYNQPQAHGYYYFY